MRTFVFLMSTLLLCACASRLPYRDAQKSCDIDLTKEGPGKTANEREQAECPSASRVQVRGRYPYELAYVEIDEQGYVESREQTELALQMAGAVSGKSGRVNVVVFVHGWHHNASAEDPFVAYFHNALESLSRWKSADRPNDSVRGILVGWRGESLTIPLLNMLTFWERKNTSDEVGRGSLLEFLLRLEREVKGRHGENSRLVVIGHSFGASVTFNSLAQLYMQRFLEGVYASGPGPRFRGYGDMVVLINPAIEAMRYMPLYSALNYYFARSETPRADFSGNAGPVLLILSSEGDWATRYFFPGARFVSTIAEVHRHADIQGSSKDRGPHSEWVMDRDTVGNYEGFNTHQMIRGNPKDDANNVDSCPALTQRDLRNKLRESETGAAVFPYSDVRLEQKKGIPPNLPYWHADLGKELVYDHNDIGKLKFVCWLSQLVHSE